MFNHSKAKQKTHYHIFTATFKPVLTHTHKQNQHFIYGCTGGLLRVHIF